MNNMKVFFIASVLLVTQAYYYYVCDIKKLFIYEENVYYSINQIINAGAKAKRARSL